MKCIQSTTQNFEKLPTTISNGKIFLQTFAFAFHIVPFRQSLADDEKGKFVNPKGIGISTENIAAALQKLEKVLWTLT